MFPGVPHAWQDPAIRVGFIAAAAQFVQSQSNCTLVLTAALLLGGVVFTACLPVRKKFQELCGIRICRCENGVVFQRACQWCTA